jgi:hypothetical protein
LLIVPVQTAVTSDELTRSIVKKHRTAMWMVVLIGILLSTRPAFSRESIKANPAVGLPPAVSTIIEQRCLKCHGPEKQKSDVRLDTLSTDFIRHRAAAETWHDALNVIQLGEMPPDDEPDLSSDQREILVTWIRAKLNEAIAASKGISEEGVMRRLNRDEYSYTMTDLLGVAKDYGALLPAEPLSKDGFQNNGAALGMSAMQLSHYLDAARNALNRVLYEGAKPEPKSITADEPANISGVLKGNASARLGRVNHWPMEIKNPPRSGRFTIRVTARAELVEGQAIPFLNLQYGNKIAGAKPQLKPVGIVQLSGAESHTYEFHGWAEDFPIIPEAGEKLQQILVINNGLKDGEVGPKPTKVKRKTTYPEDPLFPKIIIESVEFASHDHAEWPPKSHQRIVSSDERDLAPETVSTVLRRFMRRAWRRPVTNKELKTYRTHFQRLTNQTDSRIAALRETLAVVLASPNFLFLIEPREQEATRPLNDHELAARLSYFLWSSMPDQRLMTLADQGQLQSITVLHSEVARMLKDNKSARLVEQFTTQWLDLDGVKRVAVNPEFYPEFDPGLETEMVKETQLFFREILHDGGSALRLLDADFTFANAALAKHYGFTGPNSQNFQRISLAGSNRPGGLLAHAAMHLANSNGEDSHPVKRAVWIRERLLHDPPAPPPPNVPSLDSTDPDFASLPIRQQLEQHRADPACADCHRGIDPWGIALENFDAVGQWRDQIHRPTGKRGKKKRDQKRDQSVPGIPVDSKTTLPGNHEIDGIAGLQKHLCTVRREQFVHALTSKFATYALGRSLEFGDESELEKIADRFAAEGFKLGSLIREIVESELFRNR